MMMDIKDLHSVSLKMREISPLGELSQSSSSNTARCHGSEKSSHERKLFDFCSSSQEEIRIVRSNSRSINCGTHQSLQFSSPYYSSMTVNRGTSPPRSEGNGPPRSNTQAS